MEKLFLIVLIYFYCCKLEVQVSSDAAAAVKQSNDGQQQTFISSKSTAKTGEELLNEQSKFKEIDGHKNNEGNSQTQEREWAYVDSKYTFSPLTWYKFYPICNGTRQSPIALQADINKMADKTISPLKLEVSDEDGNFFGQISNDGHTFGMKIDNQRSKIRISGGPLKSQYELYQFHFHFSCEDFETGSEHSMDGQKFPAELHFVFYNVNYVNFDDAKEKSDGLAVLGFFIKLGTGLNYVSHFLNRYLIDIVNPGTSLMINYGLSLFDFVKTLREGIDKLNYVTYEGSLTTPPCYESVHWIVFQEPLKFPIRDIESWRKLKGAHGQKMCNNFRPIQHTNDRPIYYIHSPKGQ